MEVDLHIHSRFSPDSRSRPESIVARALSVGLGAIAVTDHSSWEGWRSAAKAAEGRLLVVPGAELKTDRGDLLALFVEHEIASTAFASAVDDIRSAGGLAIVPHPGASRNITRKELEMADGFEAFNATLSPAGNRLSVQKAEGLMKPGLGSSDAHLVMEIGNGRTRVEDCATLDELRKALTKSPVVSRADRSNPVVHRANEAMLYGLKGIWRKL